MDTQTPTEHRIALVDESGAERVLYEPYDYQRPWHESNARNFLAWGTRGTGKSRFLRWHAIILCLMFPYFKALIVRRTMPQLQKSHLMPDLIPYEMEMLGGRFVQKPPVAHFPNGSTITFGHVEQEKDALDYLSSEYGFIGFDELSTFTLDQFLNVSSAARAPKNAPYVAVVRAGSNPLGIGAKWMRDWFITHNVDYSTYEDYNPDDYEAVFSELSQNLSINKAEYEARLKNLPPHVRRAWLKGEFIDEGSYFTDFLPTRENDNGEKKPWHVIQEMPKMPGGENPLDVPWLNIYRSFDWGYYPDPAVCHWTIVMPNGWEIVFKEKTWSKTLAADVAKDIVHLSQGMRIIETFADPSCFAKRGETDFSVGDIIQQNGVPLRMSTNDRALYGYAINDHLNTIIEDKPKLRILDKMGSLGCPELIRSLPEMQVDPKDANKVKEGDDHWVASLAYLCIGTPAASRDPRKSSIPRWMQPRRRFRG
jgi:hypothetical protein